MTFKKSNEIDLSTIFEPRGASTKRPDVNYQDNGVDISNIYYSLTEGGNSPGNTNYRSNGTDLGNLFAEIDSIIFELDMSMRFESLDHSGATDMNMTNSISSSSGLAFSILYIHALETATLSLTGGNIANSSQEINGGDLQGNMYNEVTKVNDNRVYTSVTKPAIPYAGVITGFLSVVNDDFGDGWDIDAARTYSTFSSGSVMPTLHASKNELIVVSIAGPIGNNGPSFSSPGYYSSSDSAKATPNIHPGIGLCIGYKVAEIDNEQTIDNANWDDYVNLPVFKTVHILPRL